MAEYSVPIMFDVTAPDREAAGKAVVEILARHWRGTEERGGGVRWSLDHTRQVQIESWWTVEAEDKQHDRNDNAAGLVVFNGTHCEQCGRAHMDCQCETD